MSPSEREIDEAIGYLLNARAALASGDEGAGDIVVAYDCIALALEYLGHPTHEDNDDEA